MGTIIVAAAVLGAVVLVVRSMIRNKKNQKASHCGGDCRNCSRYCR